MHRVEDVIMLDPMTEKHERLRKARIDAGFRYASDAANSLGVTASTYRAHENGQNDFGLEEATLYGKKFGVSPLWIMASHIQPVSDGAAQPANGLLVSAEDNAAYDSPNARIGDKITGVGRRIPVYGQAVGGVDGEFEMNGNVLFEVLAPPILSGISKAYGVSISGDSMWPRYEDGEVAFVDPTRRVKKGDYVIVQIRHPKAEVPLAYVKRFIRWNSEELVLEQFNPAKELRFAAADVVTVHYIALAGNA
jgi:phage repressor protein C with HTH and peptisase S24 domain